MSHGKRLVVTVESGTPGFSIVRDATPEEVKVAEETAARRAVLVRNLRDAESALRSFRCDHVVCYDVSGYPYDSRVCLACGVTTKNI